MGQIATVLFAALAPGFGLLFVVTDPHAMPSAGVGALFVAHVASALRQREAELSRLRRVAENQERVVSLATLAAPEIQLLAPEGSELAE